MERGVRSLIARVVLHYLRLFDVASASRADVFVANSHNVARRIWKTYRRRAAVIYPPVDTDAFTLHADKDDYYVTVSRLVPYKKVPLIAEAFRAMPERRLVVIGDGPERAKVEAAAGPNVELLGHQPAAVVHEHLRRARAFVFAAEEDFGIAPLEAQACGTPVIAYGVGGARETVVDGETGLFFDVQTPAALRQAVDAFERRTFSAERIRQHAEQFSAARFRAAFGAFIAEAYERFQRGDPALDAPTTWAGPALPGGPT